MKEEKVDRRIKRTKNMMRDALMDLMDEMSFGEITAKDITSRADLNRATFYLHYNNVFELLDELENEVAGDFSQMLYKVEVKLGEDWEYPMIGQICDYIVENQRLCRCLLLNPRSDRFARKLTEIMKGKGMQVKEEMGLEFDPNKEEYIHQFIACGAMGMVKQWLLEGMPMSKEEMTDLAMTLIRPIFNILLP
ncbi:TetR/AcrR family transcriptional regulator C-terminal domain-containing protein [Anaerotignum sp.]|uniref:TetR/AcrR family transcriptional regulator n=1 Tax=Anaerotignum sp. TaxID=2039241 RepID=UPI00331B70D6